MKALCIAFAVTAALAVDRGAFAQGTTECVSVDSSGNLANGQSGSTSDYAMGASISGSGLVAVFSSNAANLIASDTNGKWDVFAHDLVTGVTERVSVDSSGSEANDDSSFPVASSDGQIVAFTSRATNLVAGDTNGFLDIFVHDRTTGITERVSVDSSGAQANGDSIDPAISGDGMVVAFTSRATNLVAGDTNGQPDIFVHDRTTGITERVSVDSSGTQANSDSSDAAISADGNVVAFFSNASNLVAGDTNGFQDVFVHDRSAGVTERVSVDSSGSEANGSSNGGSDSPPAISADGRIVAFESSARNLVFNDTNGFQDIFIHDRTTGITERESVDSTGGQGNDDSFSPAISADGLTVAFVSQASNLVAVDTKKMFNIFVHERSSGITELESADSSGKAATWFCVAPTISSDGQAVSFYSDASNLDPGGTSQYWRVYVHARCLAPATWSNYGTGWPGTNGVPGLTAQSNPVIGSSLTLDLGNSCGTFTTALLFVGFQRTSIHSGWGGDLVVLPAITLVVGVPPNGTTFLGTIPQDDTICGFVIDLQAIEADPFAAKGVSFTQGLELVVGH